MGCVAGEVWSVNMLLIIESSFGLYSGDFAHLLSFVYGPSWWMLVELACNSLTGMNLRPLAME